MNHLDFEDYPVWVFRQIGSELCHISAERGKHLAGIDECSAIHISTDQGIINIRCGDDGNLRVEYEDQPISGGGYDQQFDGFIREVETFLPKEEFIKFLCAWEERTVRIADRLPTIREEIQIATGKRVCECCHCYHQWRTNEHSGPLGSMRGLTPVGKVVTRILDDKGGKGEFEQLTGKTPAQCPKCGRFDWDIDY